MKIIKQKVDYTEMAGKITAIGYAESGLNSEVKKTKP
jgi:hypothetical protein